MNIHQRRRAERIAILEAEAKAREEADNPVKEEKPKKPAKKKPVKKKDEK